MQSDTGADEATPKASLLPLTQAFAKQDQMPPTQLQTEPEETQGRVSL